MIFMVCFINFLFLQLGFATQAQQVVCIGPIQILVTMDMVIVMMVIDMKAAMEEMKIKMVMEKKENGDRYGRNGDSYGPEGDSYGRDFEEWYGKDGYKDDDYIGRSPNNENTSMALEVGVLIEIEQPFI